MYDITNNASEFFSRVGVITDDTDFQEIGIQPNRPKGGFEKRRSRELLEFCKRHREYHIVSRVDDVTYVNSFTHMGLGYFLARGDDDLSLALCDTRNMRRSA